MFVGGGQGSRASKGAPTNSVMSLRIVTNPNHYAKQKITELIPGNKVVWLVSDSQLNFVKDKSEWNGTTITFEISKKGDMTEVRFTHAGLVPDFECYGACSNAWGSYINGSLRNLITAVKGQPKKKE